MEEASNSGEEGAIKENQAEEKPDSSVEEKELEESISMITIENGSSFQEEGTQMANEEEEEEEPNSSMEERRSEEEPTLDSKSTMEERSSFREESNFFSDLKETEKKALTDLKAKLEKEMDNKEVPLWRVPLFSTNSNDATSVILLKFLRARVFGVKESLEMIRETLKWREEGGIDSIVDDDELGSEFESACYMDGRDFEGHPVCYSVLAVFRDEPVYRKAFGSAEGRRNLLRWVARLMEKGIEKLDLRPGGVSSLVQVVDLKDSIGPWRKEVRETMKKGVHMLQDNSPEFVARNVSHSLPTTCSFFGFSSLVFTLFEGLTIFTNMTVSVP